MHGIRRAGLAGQIGGRRPRHQEDLVLVLHDLVDRERDRRRWYIDDHIDFIDVDPSAHDVGTDVGLVLMVGAEDLDFHTLRCDTEVLDRHTRRDYRSGPGDIGIKARHIGHHAKLDDAVGILGLRYRSTSECQRKRAQPQQIFHCSFLLVSRCLLSCSPAIRDCANSSDAVLSRHRTFDVSASDRLLQLGKQPFGIVQDRRIEPFGEPVVDWRQQLARLRAFALVAPKPP